MIEIRHVARDTRAAYEAIYAGRGIRQPDEVWDALLALLDITPGMGLLDVAGGEGGLARRAREYGLHGYVVDLSARAVGVGASTGVAAAVGNGEALPYADATFERVVNFGSLEHYDDPVRGAAEMARVLSPTGLALVQVPNAFGLRWSVMRAWRSGDVADDGQPIQRYATRLGWQRLLEAGGLRVVRTVAFEDLRESPRGMRGFLAAVVHPSRFLIPLARYLPVNMASMFLFLCERVADTGD
jgi:SAM-dependent methyltransferase